MKSAIASVALVAAAGLFASAADAVSPVRIRAASYNVRYKTNEDTGDKSWDSRKAILCDFLKEIDPDVIGFQEVDPPQMTDLKALLMDYEIFGKHREADNTRRGTPIAFKKSRFALLESGTFWLSLTPDVPGSKDLGDGYAGSEPETCTWAILQDHDTRGVFCFFSTHLDHKQDELRRRQMVIAVEKVMAYAGRGAPVILVGDMNSDETAPAIADVACSRLIDACLASQTVPTGPWRTFNSWSWKKNEVSCAEALANCSPAERTANKETFGNRIDYILISAGTKVESFAVRNEPQPGKEQYPSDHYPVVAELLLPCTSRDAWLRESAATRCWTGEWSEDLRYDADARAHLSGEVAFTPYTVSTGNVVTVEMKTKMDKYIKDAEPDANAQAAVRISSDGCFQVWTHLRQGYGGQAGWVDVEAQGVTPVSGAEYTLRMTFDYTQSTYSVEVKTDETEYAPLRKAGVESSSSRKDDSNSSLQLQLPTATTSFPLASSAKCVSSFVFVGDTLFTSLSGECRMVVIGFAENETVVLKDNAIAILDAAKAAWLNKCAGGDKAAAGSAAANVSSKEFEEAYLLNLDIADGERSYSFAIAEVKVGDENVTVSVTLKRTGIAGGEAAPINGTLKFYGASTIEAFKNAGSAAIEAANLTDGDFSKSDTATATFPVGENKFFKAKIEE